MDENLFYPLNVTFTFNNYTLYLGYLIHICVLCASHASLSLQISHKSCIPVTIIDSTLNSRIKKKGYLKIIEKFEEQPLSISLFNKPAEIRENCFPIRSSSERVRFEVFCHNMSNRRVVCFSGEREKFPACHRIIVTRQHQSELKVPITSKIQLLIDRRTATTRQTMRG